MYVTDLMYQMKIITGGEGGLLITICKEVM